RRVGAKDVDHFTRARGVEGYVSEMDEAGISVAVMVARSVPGVRVANEDLAAVAAKARDRLVAIASVDHMELGREREIEEATHAVKNLGMKGINIDAGFYATPLRADDYRLMPLYELCES